MLCLVARYDGHIIRFALPTRAVRLGSAPENELVVPFPGVSRHHALVEPHGDGLVLKDVGSKNGLRVGGRRRAVARLSSASAVTIGMATLAIEDVTDSDVELAFEVEMVPAKGQSGSSRETDAGTGPPKRGWGREVVRFVRELSDGRCGVQPSEFLNRARTVLACDSVFILGAGTCPGGDVEAYDGEPVADRLLARAMAVVAGAAHAKADDSVQLSLEDGRWIAVARSRVGPRAVVTVHSAAAGGVEPWQREILRYFADFALSGASGSVGPSPGGSPFGNLALPRGMVIGGAPATIRLLRHVEATVGSGLDVLLLGETGTGKEHFARLVHASGPTSSGPFVAVNCAAIPGELLESELFGVHGRVATDVDPRPGQIALAQGGTVFLDEVGELTEALQAKLLRFLQEREILPVGAPAPRRVDVRVVSASNRDLAAAARNGQFRADLYYRLRGLQYVIPPLRERREDIAALAVSFARRSADEFGRDVRGVSPTALELLARHDWPGNVRELESEVKRAVLLCPPGQALRPEQFRSVSFAISEATRKVLGGHDAGAWREQALPPASPHVHLSLDERLEVVERDAIARALAESKGNKSLAARLLGITRNGLAMKMSRLARSRG